MKQLLIIVSMAALAGCSSAEDIERERLAWDKAIYEQCENLRYVPGTPPFSACKKRIADTLGDEAPEALHNSYK